MSFSSDDLMLRLNHVSEGLLFPSETDAPLEPFVVPCVTKDQERPSVVPTDAEPMQQSLEEFFEPATEEADWMNEDERATAHRFQTLVQTLHDTLTDIRLFRTTGKEVTNVEVTVVAQLSEQELNWL